MTPALAATLADAGRMLANATAPWWVITGAAATVYGVPEPVADVDILCGIDDACRLLGAAAGPGAPHRRYRSAMFGTLAGSPLPIELMAGFDLFEGAVWRPVAFATREAVAIDGVTLWLPSRGELADLLDRIGRPKDRRRAAALRS